MRPRRPGGWWRAVYPGWRQLPGQLTDQGRKPGELGHQAARVRGGRQPGDTPVAPPRRCRGRPPHHEVYGSGIHPRALQDPQAAPLAAVSAAEGVGPGEVEDPVGRPQGCQSLGVEGALLVSARTCLLRPSCVEGKNRRGPDLREAPRPGGHRKPACLPLRERPEFEGCWSETRTTSWPPERNPVQPLATRGLATPGGVHPAPDSRLPCSRPLPGSRMRPLRKAG